MRVMNVPRNLCSEHASHHGLNLKFISFQKPLNPSKLFCVIMSDDDDDDDDDAMDAVEVAPLAVNS